MKETLNIILNILIGILVFAAAEALLCVLWWDNPITLWQESFWFRGWSILFAYSAIGMSIKQEYYNKNK